MTKAVFLDRDGVINRTTLRDGKSRAPDRLEDFEFFPDVEASVESLKDAGFLLIVVTNQPDVARGWQRREIVEEMNRKVLRELSVDDVKVCFHDNQDKCLCRKPLPGMLLEAASERQIDLEESFMIGDRYTDIAAGVAAGCKTVLIGSGESGADFIEPDFRAISLSEAVRWILMQGR